MATSCAAAKHGDRVTAGQPDGPAESCCQCQLGVLVAASCNSPSTQWQLNAKPFSQATSITCTRHSYKGQSHQRPPHYLDPQIFHDCDLGAQAWLGMQARSCTWTRRSFWDWLSLVHRRRLDLCFLRIRVVLWRGSTDVEGLSEQEEAGGEEG